MREDFLWCEKYRPKKIEDVVLPEHLKALFQECVNQKNLPNFLLAGPSGCGKTTVARAMLDQLDCDYIIINGSLNGNIDTLRNEIMNFASSVSLQGGRKYVILDEADYLNPNSTQPALRNFMEEFSKNCGFIFTCNYKNRIIEALHSRCTVIDFKINKKETAKLATQFFKRVCSILEKENVLYDKAVVAEVIQKHFPDWRRILNELQRYSVVGSIDSGILSNVQEVSLKELISHLKNKDFTSIRKWVVENINNDQNSIFRKIYDASLQNVKPQYVPMLVLLIGKYQYQASFCADAEINLMAFFAEVMIEGIY